MSLHKTNRSKDATSDGERAFEKTVSFITTKAEEQVATGAAMVPNELDKQGDFEREWLIRSFEAGYRRRLEDDEVDQGLMHVAFPDSVELEDSYVLDEETTLGDETYPEGTWVISMKVHDGELWNLVESGVISGFSIGGYISEWVGMAAEDLPSDVRVPDSFDTEAGARPVWEILAGRIVEVSLVDHPAVDRARIQETKADDSQKSGDELLDPDKCEPIMRGRGHSEEDATALCQILTHSKSMESTDPAADKAAETVENSELNDEDVGFLKWMKAFFAGPEADEPDPDAEKHSMTDETLGEAEKSLAEENADRIDELTELVTAKADDDTDAGELAAKNAERLNEIADAIDAIGKQSGESTQIGTVEETPESETETSAKARLFLGQ